jgi:hypothetical protein
MSPVILDFRLKKGNFFLLPYPKDNFEHKPTYTLGWSQSDNPT